MHNMYILIYTNMHAENGEKERLPWVISPKTLTPPPLG